MSQTARPDASESCRRTASSSAHVGGAEAGSEPAAPATGDWRGPGIAGVEGYVARRASHIHRRYYCSVASGGCTRILPCPPHPRRRAPHRRPASATRRGPRGPLAPARQASRAPAPDGPLCRSRSWCASASGACRADPDASRRRRLGSEMRPPLVVATERQSSRLGLTACASGAGRSARLLERGREKARRMAEALRYGVLWSAQETY